MKCSDINFYTFSAPFHQPVRTNLITMNERCVLIVGVIIEGKEYFAEANSFDTPWYHFETIDSVHQACRDIFNRLKRIEIKSMEELQHYLDLTQPNASSCFDYIGYQYFNALKEVTVPIGQTLHQGVTDINPTAHRVKLKMHDKILEQVSQIRKQSNIDIVIDANGLLSEKDFPLLNELAAYNILYFEQPFNQIEQYDKLMNINPNIHLAIDESATNVDVIKQFQSVGIGHAVIKYSRLGGITQSLNCLEEIRDIQFVSGGMYEFALSKYATALLGEQFSTVPDITPSGTYFEDDYSVSNERLSDGMLTMNFPSVNVNRLIRYQKNW